MAEGQPRGRAMILLAAVAAALIFGILGAGAIQLLADGQPDAAREAAIPSASAASVPATTIVYLTIPRTSAPVAEPPPSSAFVSTVTASTSRETAGATTGRTFMFPVRSEGTEYASTHHDYPAADIFASCGTPYRAPTNSVVEEVATTDVWDSATDGPATRSGLLVSLVDDRGVRYYGSHLASVSVTPGQQVAAGQQVGTVGDTGNAAGTGCHVHFGLSPSCRTGWENRRGLTYPQPFLDDWRQGGQSDPRDAVNAIGCG